MTVIDALNTVASSVFGNLAPFHLLFYSTLLGTQLFQTFINTKVCFVALPRSAFTTLQKRIFPIYFWTQTTLVVLSALTFPPHGVYSLMLRKGDWIPYAVAAVTSVMNLAVYGPQTQKAMVDCIHQETRDTHKARTNSTDDGPSAEMKVLRRAFSSNHAMSIHLNLLSIGAMLFHGWQLASRLTFNTEY
ncbi:uncharacterized protein B0H64DRAFT_248446 [Chaetomium fimeti]|uniref:TMEM205-like domain-containing protein n=1 Tax=Chaetomium fimeti TaxID=1854472 RepID=A0AAE0H837_9PEZI|nr:hypothetical protein B0H64DRAFT_248446 [Chaetomium fimeti]